MIRTFFRNKALGLLTGAAVGAAIMMGEPKHADAEALTISQLAGTGDVRTVATYINNHIDGADQMLREQRREDAAETVNNSICQGYSQDVCLSFPTSILRAGKGEGV